MTDNTLADVLVSGVPGVVIIVALAFGIYVIVGLMTQHNIPKFVKIIFWILVVFLMCKFMSNFDSIFNFLVNKL